MVSFTAVQKVMPALIERHRAEVNAIEQLRRERNSEVSKESVRREGGTASDSDENGAEENPEVATPTNSERQKRIMAPRKKFEWTVQLR
jgi:Ubinuclein conserved middle domain